MDVKVYNINTPKKKPYLYIEVKRNKLTFKLRREIQVKGQGNVVQSQMRSTNLCPVLKDKEHGMDTVFCDINICVVIFLA